MNPLGPRTLFWLGRVESFRSCMRLSPKPSAGSSEARAQYRHFFVILIGAVLVFAGLVAVFILAMHYKREADKAAKERRYRRSFLPYIDDAEGTLASAQASILSEDEDALVNARNRVRTSKAFLDRIIAQFPDYPEAHRMRGRLLLFLREFDDADVDFDNYQRLIGDDHKLVTFDRSNAAALRALREATLEPPMDLLLKGGARRAEELHAYLDWVQDTTRLENDKLVDLNKVMYAKFDFKIIQTQHFDVHYYEREAEAAQVLAAERARSAILQRLHGVRRDELQRRQQREDDCRHRRDREGERNLHRSPGHGPSRAVCPARRDPHGSVPARSF